MSAPHGLLVDVPAGRDVQGNRECELRVDVSDLLADGGSAGAEVSLRQVGEAKSSYLGRLAPSVD
jgi:hypothetical protein